MQLILKLSTKFGRASHFPGGKFWNKDTSNSFSSAKQFYYIEKLYATTIQNIK